MQEAPPRAGISEPPRRPKGSRAARVLKPGTSTWERLWPLLTEPDPGDRDLFELPRRPRTRADCRDGPRPCPWVGCKYHRYLTVSPRNGTIWVTCPDVLPWEMPDSCLLDLVEEHGEMTLDAVGRLHDMTKERMRQIEQSGLAHLRELFDEGARDEDHG